MRERDLVVEVEANGSLRPRIVALLDADGVAVVANGARGTGEIRIVAVDISQPDSLRRCGTGWRREPPDGSWVVSPRCDPLGARGAIRASANSLVLGQELEAARTGGPRRRCRFDGAAGLTALPV